MSSDTQLSIPASSPINLQYPMQYSPRGAFATNDTTVDAIADDLKILIKTNYGERLVHYDFGANLRALFFEPVENIKDQIADRIVAAVEKWMPFVTILSTMTVLNNEDPTVDYHGARIKILFGVGKTGLTGTFTVEVR